MLLQLPGTARHKWPDLSGSLIFLPAEVLWHSAHIQPLCGHVSTLLSTQKNGSALLSTQKNGSAGYDGMVLHNKH